MVLPATYFWWLDYYKEFARYLLEHYELRFQDDRTCLIFGLAEAATSTRLARQAQRTRVTRRWLGRSGTSPAGSYLEMPG